MRKLALCVLLLTSACTIDRIGSDKNEKIDKSEKEKIAVKKNEIYQAFLEKNPSLITRQFTPRVDISNFSAIDEMVSAVNVIPKPPIAYSSVGEYLVSNSNTSNVNLVRGKLSQNEFTFRFVPIANKTYISLFYIPDSLAKNQWLISAVFAKEMDDWKLYSITAGYIAYDNKIAPFYYDESMNLFRQNKIVLATFKAILASQLLNPARGNFYFDQSSSWSDYTKMIIDSFNNFVSLPKVIEQIPSKPILMAMSTDLYKGEICPVISFKTKTNLSDRGRIENEVDRVHAIIDLLIPGITETGKSIEYRVVSASSSKQYMNLYRRFD